MLHFAYTSDFAILGSNRDCPFAYLFQLPAMSGANVKPLPRALKKIGDPRVASAGANARRADDGAVTTQQRENRLGIERRSAWDRGAADAGSHWEQMGWNNNPKEYVGTETAKHHLRGRPPLR